MTGHSLAEVFRLHGWFDLPALDVSLPRPVWRTTAARRNWSDLGVRALRRDILALYEVTNAEFTYEDA